MKVFFLACMQPTQPVWMDGCLVERKILYSHFMAKRSSFYCKSKHLPETVKARDLDCTVIWKFYSKLCCGFRSGLPDDKILGFSWNTSLMEDIIF